MNDELKNAIIAVATVFLILGAVVMCSGCGGGDPGDDPAYVRENAPDRGPGIPACLNPSTHLPEPCAP